MSTIKDFHDLIRILEEHPEWRAELRRLLLTEDLLELPNIVRESLSHQETLQQGMEGIREWLEEMAKAQLATQEALRRLTERTEKVEAQIERLGERMDRVDAQIERLAVEVRNLVEPIRRIEVWQKGETGRREGERYEREVVRRAFALFTGGGGGSPEDPIVREKLSGWLAKAFEMGKKISDEEDPFLADLIWWKGEKVAVVEVSLKVDAWDVKGAKNRAGLLKSLGIDAIPMVIGKEWATFEAEESALVEDVEWLIGESFSQGFFAFRSSPSGSNE